MSAAGYQMVSGVLLIVITTIAYGGTFVLSVVRGKVAANDLQKSFFRAGHAHAAVLVVLSLVIFALLQMADVSPLWVVLAFGVPVAAVLMPSGFFLSVIGHAPVQPNSAMGLLWVGVVALLVGLVGAGAGLIVTALQ